MIAMKAKAKPYCSYSRLRANCFILSSTIVPVFNFQSLFLFRPAYIALIFCLSASVNLCSLIEMEETAVEAEELVACVAAVELVVTETTEGTGDFVASFALHFTKLSIIAVAIPFQSGLLIA